MDQDTDIGGPQFRFPETNHSAIVAVKSTAEQERQRAWETIVASYWKPAYKYTRIKWQASNEDAKDLIQGFFTNAIEKNHFASYDADKASFQTFFRTCLDRFLANNHKAASRLKRGGAADHIALDFHDAEEELVQQSTGSAMTPEEYFHQEWVRNLFGIAVEELRRRCAEGGREVYFKLFEVYDLGDEETGEKLSYASLAGEFDLKITEVTNYLAAARREFKRIVLEKLREITATDAEFRAEAKSLLGLDTR